MTTRDLSMEKTLAVYLPSFDCTIRTLLRTVLQKSFANNPHDPLPRDWQNEIITALTPLVDNPSNQMHAAIRYLCI